jgi:hypothetical protein
MGAVMIKPPLSNIPGVGVMTDTLDFVKNLWGSVNTSMGLPSMAAPTLSVEELDKKINDLKAVEAWLNVNMSMLRGTIQALEVQRGTIATLKSVGATLSAAVKQQPPASADENKSLLESIPYASAFLYPNANPNPTASEPEATARAPADAEPESGANSGTDNGADNGASLVNPLLWWNVLQDQFKQAVSTAAVTDTMAKLGAAGTAMATDAVVKLGEVAAKSNLAAKSAGSESAPARKKRANQEINTINNEGQVGSARKSRETKVSGGKRKRLS